MSSGLHKTCRLRFGAVCGMIIASLMLLSCGPVAAVNPRSGEVLQEGNSPPSVDVPYEQVGIYAVSTVFKATCTELDPADQLRLTWNWGDGKVSVTNHQSNGGNLTASAAHTYKLRQYYTLTVWIDDLTGLPDHNVSDQGRVRSIPLADHPPVIASFEVSTLAPVTGQLVTFSATVTDSQACAVSFEFGDGTSAEVSQLWPDSTVSVQHTYLTPGAFSAFVYSSDGYILSLPSETATVEVSRASFSLALVPGWNLVCNPLINNTMKASTLGLMTGDIVAGWNPATQTYDRTYVVGVSPAFKDFSIEPSTGYWVKATQAETIHLKGDLPSSPQSREITVPVPGGWATIGLNSLRKDIHASDVVGMYSGGDVLVVVAHHPWGYQIYNPLLPSIDFLLVPGQGYWIFVTGSGTFSYNP